jgi:hypothetical protein
MFMTPDNPDTLDDVTAYANALVKNTTLRRLAILFPSAVDPTKFNSEFILPFAVTLERNTSLVSLASNDSEDGNFCHFLSCTLFLLHFILF